MADKKRYSFTASSCEEIKTVEVEQWLDQKGNEVCSVDEIANDFFYSYFDKAHFVILDKTELKPATNDKRGFDYGH